MDLPPPFGPRTATRSCQPISRSTGPRVKPPRVTTASSRRATTSPLRGPGPGPAGAASPPTACRPPPAGPACCSLARTLDACFSVRLTKKPRWALSWSCGPLLGLADALLRPGPLGPDPLGELRRSARRSGGRPPPAGCGPGPGARRTRSSRRRTRRPGGSPPRSRGSGRRCGRGRPGRGTRPPPPPGSPARNPSSRSRPAKSRSLVGSSSRNTSKRDSRMAASPARAAWPPDRSPTATSRRSAGRPSSAHTVAARASKSSPPRARKRSSASL